MNKIVWTTCICIFIFVTVFVISLDNSVDNHSRVKFTNKNFEITNENNEIVNDTNTAKISLSSSGIKNKDFVANNSSMNIENSESSVSYQSNNFDNKNKITYKNLDDSQIDLALKNKGHIDTQRNDYGEIQPKYTDKKPILPPPEYEYRDVDWGKWKSNFVNRILDDSLTIKELDSYPNGSWFYYSFIVDDEGRIGSITLRSMYLNNADKNKVINLIKQYEHSYLTKFPENSNRKTAKVSAIMMLSNESTVRSKPSDFKDVEHIKSIKY